VSRRAKPARRRERLPRDERMAAIMEVARGVFCEKGYAEASTAEIAARAGVVEGTLYRYFPSKRDLLIKVVEAFYERIFADYERQLQGVRGTWNRLRYLIWKHLSVFHGDPAMCRLIVHELRPSPQYRQSSVFELNRRYTERTLAVIKEGITAGEFEERLPLRLVRDMIFGCAEHHTWAYLRGEGQFSPEDAPMPSPTSSTAALRARSAARLRRWTPRSSAWSRRCSASRGWRRHVAGRPRRRADVRPRTHRQPRRDRLPHPAHAQGPGHRKRRGVPPRGPRRAPRAAGR